MAEVNSVLMPAVNFKHTVVFSRVGGQCRGEQNEHTSQAGCPFTVPSRAERRLASLAPLATVAHLHGTHPPASCLSNSQREVCLLNVSQGRASLSFVQTCAIWLTVALSQKPIKICTKSM